MGELWRSKEMTLVQLFVQFEAAHDTVEALGQLGMLQFVDLNPSAIAHQRHFVPDIKRVTEMQLIVDNLVEQIRELNLSYIRTSGKRAAKSELIKLTPYQEVKEQHLHMDVLEERLNDLKTQVDQLNSRQSQLDQTMLQIIELKAILGKDEEGFFAEVGDEVVESSEDNVEGADFQLEDLGPIEDKKGKERMRPAGNDDVLLEDDNTLRFITGVIPRNRFENLDNILFRVSKGQALMKYREIEEDIREPGSKEAKQKNSFIVFHRGKYLGDKITKLCLVYQAHVYPCPDSPKERRNLRHHLQQRLDEINVVVDKSIQQKAALLQEIAQSIDLWHHFLLKELAIYHTLNMFNFNSGRQTLIGECWCPTEAIERAQEALVEAQRSSGATLKTVMNVIETKQEPPTYFKTNSFTKVFQKIVDAYGIARYREVNPAVFTIITFPWQFGIMFGDVGHGLLLVLFSLFLIYMQRHWEGKPLNEMLAWPYKGRFLLLLMGLYAMWMGALYNEIFSVTMDFGSNWQLQVGPQYGNDTFQPKVYGPDGTYAFGVDPVWKAATNSLLYYNSVKMKMSIIVGVIQMSVGLVLHCLNGIEFNKPFDIWFEFLPRLLFLEAIFGYLCFMIFYKWCRDYWTQDIYNIQNNINGTAAVGYLEGTGEAPLLLNELIYMVLPGGPPDNLYPNQGKVQTALIIIAFVSIPLMFLPKPILLLWQHKKEIRKSERVVTAVDEDPKVESSSASLEDEYGDKVDTIDIPAPKPTHAAGDDEEEFQFGELMIHQMLETIEFVLGSVSHTASYLRLWALSLAHSELATVFWDKIMFQVITFTTGTSIVAIGFILFAGFSVWWIITLMVMMFMELLSALLHALRLHWVEFQSKFYKGDGYQFKPLSFRKIYSANSIKDVTKSSK